MKKTSILWIFLVVIIIAGVILYLRKRGVIGEEAAGEEVTEADQRRGPTIGGDWIARTKERILDLLTRQPPVVVGGNGTMPRIQNGPTWYPPQENAITLWKENGITLEPVAWREGGLTLEEKRIIDRDLERLAIPYRPYITPRPNGPYSIALPQFE